MVVLKGIPWGLWPESLVHGKKVILKNFGRNAVQAHNHAREDWKDFHTQNFTPIATHFALFPIVELGGTITAVERPLVMQQQLTLFPTYPNPATSEFTINYSLSKASNITIHIHDLQGRQLYWKNLGMQTAGDNQQGINVQNFPGGTYIYRVESDNMKLTGKVFVK